jgi:hypothetical protein
MPKKISMVIGFAIVTILTALSFSNQAFARPGGWVIDTGVFARHEAQLGKILGGQEAQLGKVLAGQLGKVLAGQLGKVLAGHEPQLGELDGAGKPTILAPHHGTQ